MLGMMMMMMMAEKLEMVPALVPEMTCLAKIAALVASLA